MRQALSMEFYKCRRRRIPLVCLGMILVQLAWIGAVLLRMDPEEFAQGWQWLLYNLMLLDAITMPVTAGTLASRSCDLEHKGAGLKLLETLLPAGRLYSAKLCWGALVLFLTLAVRSLLLAALGLAYGFPGAVPWGRFAQAFLVSFLVSLTICVLQQDLSLLFKNQAVALATAIFGSFVGLLSMLFPVWVQRLVLWGYYGVMSPVGMDWDPETRFSAYYWINLDGTGLLLTALWFAALFLAGRALFIKKEV